MFLSTAFQWGFEFWGSQTFNMREWNWNHSRSQSRLTLLAAGGWACSSWTGPTGMDSVRCGFRGLLKVRREFQLLATFTEKSGNDYSQGLPCFNWEKLQKWRDILTVASKTGRSIRWSTCNSRCFMMSILHSGGIASRSVIFDIIA